jgi:hypothetical protein
MTPSFLRRWLGGWRGVLVAFAFSVVMTALGLSVQAHSVGGLSDPQFRLVAQAAGAADLFFVLRFFSETVIWLHHQSVKLQRHVNRALSGEWREVLLWRG